MKLWKLQSEQASSLYYSCTFCTLAHYIIALISMYICKNVCIMSTIHVTYILTALTHTQNQKYLVSESSVLLNQFTLQSAIPDYCSFTSKTSLVTVKKMYWG